MSKSLGYIGILCIYLIAACTGNKQELKFTPPVFPATTHLSGKILVDTFIMGLCYDINTYKDYLIVSTYRGDGEILNIFDKHNGRHLKGLLRRGKGAGEVLSLRDFDLDQTNGDLLFYDVMDRKIVTCNIDSVLAHTDADGWIHSRTHPIYMYKILRGNGCYIAEGGHRENGKSVRLTLIRDDSVIFRYRTFPEIRIPGTDARGIEAAYIYGSRIAISPGRKQIAYTTNYGAILEIFDITAHEIKLNTIKGFYRPAYTLEGNNLVSLPGETIWGFFDLYATGRYIYTIFSGSTDSKATKNIAVFDWKGNGVHLYTTDYRLEKICVDEKSGKIYANGLDKNFETVIFEFDLPR